MTSYDPHTPLTGAIHQPVDPADASAYLPELMQQTAASGGQPMVMIVQQPAPATGAVGGALGPVGSRLLVGAGIGAGAVVAFALVGPALIAMLQALATAAIAIGGLAVALAVAAVALMSQFKRDTAPAGKGRRR
jgi:hypothetical protein